MNRKIICLVAAVFLSAKAFSSFDFNERVQKAYLQVIRLKFDEGKRLLDEEQQQNPSNLLPLLYYNYIDFLRAFITEEKKDFETFSDNSEKRLKKIEDEQSFFSLYATSEIMMQDAMLRVKQREFISAAWEIRKAYKVVEKNMKLYPSFLLNKKSIGFLHVLVGSVPKNYRNLVKLVGMEGTIVQGKEELFGFLDVIEKTSYQVYKEETLFYLSTLHGSFAGEKNNIAKLVEAMKPFAPKNPLMRYSLSNILMKEGSNDEALKTLTDTTSLSGTLPFYFLSYKTGLAKLQKLDFTAQLDFVMYTSYFHGSNYIRSAYQRLAWINLLKGDKKKYSELIALCKTRGSDFVDEDKDATNEAASGEIPNLILLRTRLLFDGGYYAKALSEIAGKSPDSFPRFKDHLELTYRFARILDRMKQGEKAIEFFNETIKNGESSTYYFAANAALLLGNMYEEKGDFASAKKNYERCLAMRNHEYQNSIDQKAQAGLERLKMKN